jgi:ABC-type antimicrobial peptide transport system permease subunit
VLTESVMLALAGGAVGVGIAEAGVRLLASLQRGVPRLAETHVNAPALLFALGVSLLTGLLFGIAPALRSGRAELVSALKEGGRGTSGATSLRRTRAALTVAQVALGAQRSDVVRLVVGQAMAMAVVGVAIGVLLALWGGKGLSSMLYGVGPRDPLVLGASSVFLLAVAFAAALAPALRAMRIDPTIAMRAD